MQRMSDIPCLSPTPGYAIQQSAPSQSWCSATSSMHPLHASATRFLKFHTLTSDLQRTVRCLMRSLCFYEQKSMTYLTSLLLTFPTIQDSEVRVSNSLKAMGVLDTAAIFLSDKHYAKACGTVLQVMHTCMISFSASSCWRCAILRLTLDTSSCTVHCS